MLKVNLKNKRNYFILLPITIDISITRWCSEMLCLNPYYKIFLPKSVLGSKNEHPIHSYSALFLVPKASGGHIPPASEKANRGSGRPRRFTESGLGIRSSSLDSPPPRAGFEQVQIALQVSLGVHQHHHPRSDWLLRALRRRKVISRLRTMVIISR